MEFKTRIFGALIVDVVRSRSQSRLSASLSEKLRISSIAQMKDKLIQVPYAVTAGDEFETIASRVEHIPRLILDLRRRLQPFQLRIGVGLGTIEAPIRAPVNQLAGRAFELARDAISSVKRGRKYSTLTVFRSNNKDFDRMANLVYGLHDTFIFRITGRQWETLGMYLIKDTLDYAAKALSIDVSTVSRNLKRGFFWQLQDTVTVMEEFCRQSFQ